MHTHASFAVLLRAAIWQVAVRGLSAVVAMDPSQQLSPACPRLELDASSLSVSIAAGRVDVTATALSLLAHAAGPGRGPGEAYYAAAAAASELRGRLPDQ